jgi:glycosyltransferase involved in cell wall biosynthesis
MMQRSVLVATIAARSGGVPVMTGFAVEMLKSLGLTPIIAYYEPYSVTPNLSVPFFALGRRRPSSKRAEPMFDCETHAMGAWLPELEFTTYGLTDDWRALIERCAFHVAVSGNILAARPMVLAQRDEPVKRNILAWIATDWHGDRVDRVKQFGFARRLLDRFAVTPITTRIERQLIEAVHPIALSDHTAAQMSNAQGIGAMTICPTPIDTEFFKPDAHKTETNSLIFTGRLDDPRKNVGLLIDAVAELVRRGRAVKAVLVGANRQDAAALGIAQRGLTSHFEFLPYLDKASLADRLQRADVFVLPSFQEGLCIAALEAMACGVPVVSTRCGGPQEFVLPDETGALVDFDAIAMADAVEKILVDRTMRTRLGHAARALVESRYSVTRARDTWLAALRSAFPGLGA